MGAHAGVIRHLPNGSADPGKCARWAHVLRFVAAVVMRLREVEALPPDDDLQSVHRKDRKGIEDPVGSSIVNTTPSDSALGTVTPTSAGTVIVWLSTGDAAKRLGVTTRTLYRFIDEGQLPAYRFGRVIRLKQDEVDRFIDACRIEPGTLEHLYPEAVPAKD